MALLFIKVSISFWKERNPAQPGCLPLPWDLQMTLLLLRVLSRGNSCSGNTSRSHTTGSDLHQCGSGRVLNPQEWEPSGLQETRLIGSQWKGVSYTTGFTSGVFCHYTAKLIKHTFKTNLVTQSKPEVLNKLLV